MVSIEHKLSNFDPWSADDDVAGRFILVLDKTASGMTFPFLHMLLKLLKETQASAADRGEGCDSVLLVSCNFSRKHYESILRKNVSVVSESLYQLKLETL